MMKHIWKVVLCAGALLACDSPTENDGDVVVYDLVEFWGHPVPFGSVNGACADTTLNGSIRLLSETEALWTISSVRNCGGERSLSTTERSGAYLTIADTMRFTWQLENDPLLSTIEENGLLSGNRLNFVEEVYTVEGARTVVRLGYRRR